MKFYSKNKLNAEMVERFVGVSGEYMKILRLKLKKGGVM